MTPYSTQVESYEKQACKYEHENIKQRALHFMLKRALYFGFGKKPGQIGSLTSIKNLYTSTIQRQCKDSLINCLKASKTVYLSNFK